MDADDYHPASNKQKMANGIPLADEVGAVVCAHVYSLNDDVC